MNGTGSVALPTTINQASGLMNNRGVVSIDNLTATMGAAVAAIPTIGNVVSLCKSVF